MPAAPIASLIPHLFYMAAIVHENLTEAAAAR